MILKSPNSSLKRFLGAMSTDEDRRFNACLTVTVKRKKSRRMIVDTFGDVDAWRLKAKRRIEGLNAL